MSSHSHSDRRWFLKRGALFSFMMGAVRSLRGQTPARETPLKDNFAYGQPSPFDDTIRRTLGQLTAVTDTALTTPLQDLDGIITPSGLHFLMDRRNLFLREVPLEVTRPVFAGELFDVGYSFDVGELARLLALELYREDKVSLGRAAEICHTPIAAFMDFAAKHAVPPLRYSFEELEEEHRSTDELGV